METLTLSATEDTPEVVLNRTKGIFKIAGNSYAEDPFAIYERIFSWLKEYSKGPNKVTVFEFQLNYINTASSKQIFEILRLLEALSEKADVTIYWYYVEGDDDTLDEGQELSGMFKLNFNFLEI